MSKMRKEHGDAENIMRSDYCKVPEIFNYQEESNFIPPNNENNKNTDFWGENENQKIVEDFQENKIEEELKKVSKKQWAKSNDWVLLSEKDENSEEKENSESENEGESSVDEESTPVEGINIGLLQIIWDKISAHKQPQVLKKKLISPTISDRKRVKKETRKRIEADQHQQPIDTLDQKIEESEEVQILTESFVNKAKNLGFKKQKRQKRMRMSKGSIKIPVLRSPHTEEIPNVPVKKKLKGIMKEWIINENQDEETILPIMNKSMRVTKKDIKTSVLFSTKNTKKVERAVQIKRLKNIEKIKKINNIEKEKKIKEARMAERLKMIEEERRAKVRRQVEEERRKIIFKRTETTRIKEKMKETEEKKRVDNIRRIEEERVAEEEVCSDEEIEWDEERWSEGESEVEKAKQTEILNNAEEKISISDDSLHTIKEKDEGMDSITSSPNSDSNTKANIDTNIHSTLNLSSIFETVTSTNSILHQRISNPPKIITPFKPLSPKPDGEYEIALK